MTLTFHCSACDVLLKVADSAAGKKCKCPKCGTVNPVPAAVPEEVEEAEPVEEPAPPRKKKAVPQAIVPEPAVKTKRRVRPPDDGTEYVDDADEPDEEEKPRKGKGKGKKGKAKKGSKKLLYIGGIAAGLCFLLIAGAAAGLAWWYFGGGTPDEFQYFPDNVTAINSERVDQTRNSAAYKEIVATLGQDKGMVNHERLYGIPPTNIDRVSTGTTRGGDGVTAVRTLGAVQAGDIAAKFKQQDTNQAFNEVTVGKYTINEPKTAAQGFSIVQAFCVVNSKTVLFGKAATLRSVLERGKTPTYSTGMQAALKKADFSRSHVTVQDYSGTLDPLMIGGGFGFGPGLAGKNRKVEHVVQNMHAGSDISVRTTYTFSDTAQVNDAKKDLDDNYQKSKTEPMFKEIAADVKYDSWVSGNAVVVEMRIPAKTLAKVLGGLK